tara:strand:+ start:242 stop:631 length:390 start_codon:yes stop_codon:yes gene_type:complete
MASFAKIGLDSKVIEVLSVHNDELKDSNGNEVEQLGIDFLTILTGWSVWKQTSYNTRRGEHRLGKTPLRKNHAGKGYTYDQARDAFIPPQPYPSWVLNEDTCQWEAPVPYPDNDKMYRWDEGTTSWKEI